MPENTQRVSVGGFSFENKDEAEQAKKEIEGIKYIKAKTDMSDPEVILQVYNKMIGQKLFETAVGYSYLKDLQEYSPPGLRDTAAFFPDILSASFLSGFSTRHHVRKQPPAQKDRRGSFRFGTPPDFHAVRSPAVLNNVRGCRYVSYFPGPCPFRRPLYSSLAEPSYGRPLSRFLQYFCSLSASLPPVCRDF